MIALDPGRWRLVVRRGKIADVIAGDVAASTAAGVSIPQEGP